MGHQYYRVNTFHISDVEEFIFLHLEMIKLNVMAANDISTIQFIP